MNKDKLAGILAALIVTAMTLVVFVIIAIIMQLVYGDWTCALKTCVQVIPR